MSYKTKQTMETKHTKGEWQVTTESFNKQQLHDGFSIMTEIDGTAIYIATVEAIGFNSKETDEANAKLIAEAGTVASETGKTPRRLADENKELLEALIRIKSMTNQEGSWLKNTFLSYGCDIDKVINKVK